MKKHRIDKRLIKLIALAVIFYVAFLARILSMGKMDAVLWTTFLVILIGLIFWLKYFWKKQLVYDQLTHEEKEHLKRNSEVRLTRTGALIITGTAVVFVIIVVLTPEHNGKPDRQLLVGITCAIISLAAIFGLKKNDRT